jgi:nucleotide-binding universal stress UspA family protein
MAADILVYRATHVPVGEDQKQHLELSRDIAQKFNNDFGASIQSHGHGEAFFPLPEPLIQGLATRVMSLRDGTKKMSKSDASDYSRINLTDDADAIAQKIRKAKTDPEPLPHEEKGLEQRPEADNLVGIYAALADTGRAQVLAQFGGAQFSAFKAALIDLLVGKLAPLNGEMRRLIADPAYIDQVLADGAQRAQALAAETMKAVKDIVGFVHRRRARSEGGPDAPGPMRPCPSTGPHGRIRPQAAPSRSPAAAGGRPMSLRRRSYEPGHSPKFLVVIDDTPECDRALYFASRRALRTGASVLMLRVIEMRDRNQQWLGVADIMRAEAHEEANAALDRAGARAGSITGVTPERVVREGEMAEEILNLIEEDEDIALLILAASSGTEGPGPLVASLAKTAGTFPIPVAIVPGHLSDEDLESMS